MPHARRLSVPVYADIIVPIARSQYRSQQSPAELESGSIGSPVLAKMPSSSNVQVSFVAKVELIQLHSQKEHSTLGLTPPITAADFNRGGIKGLLIWRDGTMQRFNGECPGGNQKYSAATVFSQGQSRALLSVLCDAAVSNVDIWGWRPLMFEAGLHGAASTLSHVGVDGKCDRLPAPLQTSGGQACVRQLLPKLYHHPDNQNSQLVITGLFGTLPILIALAALSTSAGKIEHVLSSIKQHRWERHAHEQGKLRGKYDLRCWGG